MAHTDRRTGDKRVHPKTFARGTRVGIRLSSGVHYGKVADVDGGGWIYVDWPADTALPSHCRATNLFKAPSP